MLNTFEIPTPYPAQVGTGKVITRQKVLFVCSSNASLSQLGAAFFRYFDPESSRFEVYSAGSGPRVANRLHPLAAAMIEELGQDSNKIRPKALSEFCNTTFDYVFIGNMRTSFTIDDWSVAIDELVRVTKVGGWLEFSDSDVLFKGGPLANDYLAKGFFF